MLLFSFLLLITAPIGAAAQGDPVLISGGRIPHVFDPEEPGPYNQIIDLMKQGVSRPVVIEYFPMPLAMRQMQSGRFDCFAMALKHSPNWARLGMDPNNYIFVGPIAWLRVRLYVAAGKMGAIDPASGDAIAVDSTIFDITGAFAEEWQNANLVKTSSFIEALQAVADGQVAAAMAYDVDVNSLAPEHPLQDQVKATGPTIAEMEDGLMCKGTDGMLPVILGLQEGLDRIATDGTLDRILSEQ